MPKGAAAFEIDDAKSFDENLAEFRKYLTAADAELGPVLAAHLEGVLRGTTIRADVWGALSKALAPKAGS